MIYMSLSLSGNWEMGYSENSYKKNEEPVFEAFEIENAVPGYWEDMTDKFIEAPFYQNLKVNPSFGRQKYPIAYVAPDMALPNYIGNFFYKRKFTLDDISEECVLHFGGVQNTVSVWVNSTFLGTHCGYSTPFDINVPCDVLTSGANNIVLSVSNFPLEGYGGNTVSGGQRQRLCIARAVLRKANPKDEAIVKKNEEKVDNFLRNRGMDINSANADELDDSHDRYGEHDMALRLLNDVVSRDEYEVGHTSPYIRYYSIHFMRKCQLVILPHV